MTRTGKRRRRQQMQRYVTLLLVVMAITIATVTTAVSCISAGADDDSIEKKPTVAPEVERDLVNEPAQVIEPVHIAYETSVQADDPEEPVQETHESMKEPENINQELSEEKSLHEEIPLDYDLQRHLITVCEEYGVPYHIALGVIQAESSFITTASNGSCYGLMQINNINAEWLEKEIDVTDLTDPYQNVRAGVFILNDLFADYGDWHKTLIAYNYGPAGAQKYVFSKGYTTTEYSRTVMTYADAWLEVVEND